MLGRLALAGTMVIAMGASVAVAGSPGGLLFWLYNKCDDLAKQSQCAVQITHGDDNLAVMEQTTKSRSSTQLGITLQNGDNNQAYTGQVGKNQISLTTQSGDGHGGFIYQEGKYNYSTTKQDGNGTWAASSSIGDGTHAIVTVTN
jgi:hypothetical protein